MLGRLRFVALCIPCRLVGAPGEWMVMNKSVVLRMLCGAALVAIVLAGCSVPGDSVASIQHSKGSYIYSNPGEGFSLKVPDSWVFISPDSKELEATISKVKQANPALAKSLESGPLKGQFSNMADSGVKILAYDTASDVATTNFATNMNVVHMQVPSEFSTLDQVANENVNELKKAYGSMLTTEIERTKTHVGAA